MFSLQHTEPGSWGLDMLDYPVDDTYSWYYDGTGVNIYIIGTSSLSFLLVFFKFHFRCFLTSISSK